MEQMNAVAFGGEFFGTTALVTTALLERLYPVGIHVTFATAGSPAGEDKLGFGTWKRVALGKSVFGVDENDADFAMGAKGGEKKHALTVAEMPAHDHPTGGGTLQYLMYGGQMTLTGGNSYWAHIRQTIPAQGGNRPHNNLPPYETAYIWERTA